MLKDKYRDSLHEEEQNKCVWANECKLPGFGCNFQGQDGLSQYSWNYFTRSSNSNSKIGFQSFYTAYRNTLI